MLNNIVSPVTHPNHRVITTNYFKEGIFPEDSGFVALQKNLWNAVPQLAGDKGFMAKATNHNHGYAALAPSIEGTGYFIGSWLSNQGLFDLKQKREAALVFMEAPSIISREQASSWMLGVKELSKHLHSLVQDINETDPTGLKKLFDTTKDSCLDLLDFRKLVPSRLAIIDIVAESSPSEVEGLLGRIQQKLHVKHFSIELTGQGANSLNLTGLGLTSSSMQAEPVVSPAGEQDYEFTRFALRDEHPEFVTRINPDKIGEIQLGAREQTPRTEIEFHISEQKQKIRPYIEPEMRASFADNIANFDASFIASNKTIQRIKLLLAGL